MAQMAVVVFVYIACIGVSFFTGTTIGKIICPGNVAYYLPVFLMGVICRLHSKRFLAMCSSTTPYTICLAILAACLYIFVYGNERHGIPTHYYAPLRPVTHIVPAVVAIGVLKPWSDRVFESGDAHPLSSAIARWLCTLGKASLSIYLLHYFFLFPLGWLSPYLEQMNVAFVPFVTISIIISTIIICIVLGVVSIIKKSPILGCQMLGDGWKKAKS